MKTQEASGYCEHVALWIHSIHSAPTVAVEVAVVVAAAFAHSREMGAKDAPRRCAQCRTLRGRIISFVVVASLLLVAVHYLALLFRALSDSNANMKL